MDELIKYLEECIAVGDAWRKVRDGDRCYGFTETSVETAYQCDFKMVKAMTGTLIINEHYNSEGPYPYKVHKMYKGNMFFAILSEADYQLLVIEGDKADANSSDEVQTDNA